MAALTHALVVMKKVCRARTMARWKALRLGQEAALGARLSEALAQLKEHAAVMRMALEQGQAADGAVRAYVKEAEQAMEDDVTRHEAALAQRSQLAYLRQRLAELRAQNEERERRVVEAAAAGAALEVRRGGGRCYDGDLSRHRASSIAPVCDTCTRRTAASGFTIDVCVQLCHAPPSIPYPTAILCVPCARLPSSYTSLMLYRPAGAPRGPGGRQGRGQPAAGGPKRVHARGGDAHPGRRRRAGQAGAPRAPWKLPLRCVLLSIVLLLSHCTLHQTTYPGHLQMARCQAPSFQSVTVPTRQVAR